MVVEWLATKASVERLAVSPSMELLTQSVAATEAVATMAAAAMAVDMLAVEAMAVEVRAAGIQVDTLEVETRVDAMAKVEAAVREGLAAMLADDSGEAQADTRRLQWSHCCW